MCTVNHSIQITQVYTECVFPHNDYLDTINVLCSYKVYFYIKTLFVAKIWPTI